MTSLNCMQLQCKSISAVLNLVKGHCSTVQYKLHCCRSLNLVQVKRRLWCLMSRTDTELPVALHWFEIVDKMGERIMIHIFISYFLFHVWNIYIETCLAQIPSWPLHLFAQNAWNPVTYLWNWWQGGRRRSLVPRLTWMSLPKWVWEPD